MDGGIGSAFLITEPNIASSDAINIRMDMRKEATNGFERSSKPSSNFKSITAPNARQKCGQVELVMKDVRSTS